MSRRRVLAPIGTVQTAGSAGVTHQVIEGESLEALNLLAGSHAGSVDVVFISPPTPSDPGRWADDVISGAKAGQTWTQFMRRRLAVAKELLTDTGVVAVSTSDRHHHIVRNVLDDVFGAANFITTLVWVGDVDSRARFTSGGLNHVAVYALNASRVRSWRELNDGAERIAEIGYTADQVGRVRAEQDLRAWLARNRDGVAAELQRFDRVDQDGRVYALVSLVNPKIFGGFAFRITAPDGTVHHAPVNGWEVTKERYADLVADDLVVFGGKAPARKVYLDERFDVRPDAWFVQKRGRAVRHLTNLAGPHRFRAPADHEVLMRWFAMWAPTDGVFVDFFAGSGSTGEAVMRLNAADGGSRQVVLVNDNSVPAGDVERLTGRGFGPGDDVWVERGVFRSVLMPRLQAAASGVRADGSPTGLGVCPARVEFWSLIPRPIT